MDKQEPVFNKPDMDELQFRTRASDRPARSPPRTDEHAGLWLKAGAAVFGLVLIIMGLIEWNARRQAAAMTAELLRPMTPQEEAQFNSQMEKERQRIETETQREIAAMQRQLRAIPAPQPQYAPRQPLQPGQRCIGGKRLERINGGWRDIPNSPC